MQASPSLDMTVSRQGVWRSSVAVLVALAAAALFAWWLASARPMLLAQIIGLPLAAACLFVAAACAWPYAPVRLRWDGRNWWIAPGAEPERLVPVDVSVALDLGPWMLLRLHREGVPRWRGRVWLPVQRRGHEARWHALRCAVYSPRPAPGGPPAAEP